MPSCLTSSRFTDQKMNDDRAKRVDRQRSERQAIDDAKRAETNERLLEEAQAPAFEREIEDCSTLIYFFERRIGVASTSAPSTRLGGPSATGLPKLELRTVETAAPVGGVALKKKGEQEEESFMCAGGKKGKKGKKAPLADGEEAPVVNQALNLPFGTLSALLTLGITSPITVAQVPKTIEALETKKQYFTDNQVRSVSSFMVCGVVC